MVRPLSSLLVVCLLTFASPGCRSNQEKIEAFLARGDAYVADHALREAAIEYKNVIQLDPNHAVAHGRLAEALLDLGAIREGLWELREAIRLDPSNREAMLRLAQASILARDFDEGLALADLILADDPMNAAAQLLRAQALEAQKKFDSALDAYQTGLQLARGKAEEPAALRMIAGYQTRRGDFASAGPHLEQLVEVAPDSASWIALAEHRRRVGKSVEAQADHRKAVEVATARERSRAYAALAGFLYESGQIAEGVKALQQGIGEVENALDLTYLLARFYNLQGAHELADELIRKSAAGASDDIRPHLVLSSYESSRGRQAEALVAVEQALAIDANNLEARIWRAELLVDRGQRENDEASFREARRVIDPILETQPDQPDALVARAKIELVQSNTKEALEALTTAIAARPDWAVPHHRAATVHALLGDWAEARAEAARAIELDPTLVDARKQLVRAHQALGEHEYAVEAAQKTLRERPDDAEIRTRLAESLFALGRPKEAAEALNLVPETLRTPEVHFARAQLALADGRFADARAIFGKALEQRPTSPEVLQSLLALDVREGKLDQAVARIAEAIRKEPGNARLEQLRGVAALAQGKPAEAEEALRKAVALAPDDATSVQALADFLARAGRETEAAGVYETALARRADDAGLHFRLALLHERAGDRDRAIERYEAALAHDPKLAEAANNLAFLLAESGTDLDRALELAREARELLPDDPTTADTLGWVFYKRELPATAIEHLREAESGRSAGDPERGAVRHHLALAYEADGQLALAVEVARRALAELETTAKGSRTRGNGAKPEPTWARDLRALVTRASADGRTNVPASDAAKSAADGRTRDI